MPAEIVVGYPLHFWVDGIVASLTHHSVILHVAGLAHRLVIDHHVYFASQDVVTVKAAEVFQMPILVFCLGILIAEYQLITAGTSGFLAVTVVSATEQLPILPEINHVDQQFRAGAADKTRWVPQFIIAGPLGIDGGVALLHAQLAAIAEILSSFALGRFALHGPQGCRRASVPAGM